MLALFISLILGEEIRLANLKEGAIIFEIDKKISYKTEKDHYVYVVPVNDQNYFILDELQNRAIYEVDKRHLGFFRQEELNLDIQPSFYKEYSKKEAIKRELLLKFGFSRGKMVEDIVEGLKLEVFIEIVPHFFIGPVINEFKIDQDYRFWQIYAIGGALLYFTNYQKLHLGASLSYLPSLKQNVAKDPNLNQMDINNSYRIDGSLSLFYEFYPKNLIGIDFNYQNLALKYESNNIYQIGISYMRRLN